MKAEKQIILFGAGNYGRKALAYFGRERVYGFIDNNPALVGTSIDGLPVISFAELVNIHSGYEIVIAASIEILFSIAAQLEEAGIHDYKIFLRILAEAQGFPNNAEEASAYLGGEKQLHADVLNGRRSALMVAYLFPPIGGSGVFRSIKFAKYLPEFGWNPMVISTDHPPIEMNYTDESLVQEIPDGVEVIRIPDRIGTMRKTSFSVEDEQKLLSFLESVFQKSGEASERFHALAQTNAGKTMLMTFPCYSLLWAWDVIQFIEKNISMSEFKVIYTTSMPYSTHLIGFYFKEKYGIPWVADYRDPWTESAYLYEDKSDSRFKLLRELESILLKAADKNIWVEENTTQLHKQHFNLPQNKVSSITNGYDEADFADLEVSEAQPEKFTIVYCGVAMVPAIITGIQAFFSALRPLLEEGKLNPSKVSCWFIGDARQSIQELAESYGVGGVVRESGYHPHKEALRANLDANLLLHVIGDGERQKYAHASKIFEYLRCGRPILSLAPTDGVVAQTLRETGHGKAYLNTDIPGIQSMILQEYQKWQRNEKRELLHSPLIEQFERKHLTGQLAAILDEVSR